MLAARLDLGTGATSRSSTLARFEDDDHNNPALLAVAGRPLVCFYSRHDAEEGLRYRISQAAARSRRLGRRTDPAIRRPDHLRAGARGGDELHLFTRVNETRWGWRCSTDWAQNLGPAARFPRLRHRPAGLYGNRAAGRMAARCASASRVTPRNTRTSRCTMSGPVSSISRPAT